MYCFQVSGSAFFMSELETIIGMVFTQQHCLYKVYEIHNSVTMHFCICIATVKYYHLHYTLIN